MRENARERPGRERSESCGKEKREERETRERGKRELWERVGGERERSESCGKESRERERRESSGKEERIEYNERRRESRRILLHWFSLGFSLVLLFISLLPQTIFQRQSIARLLLKKNTMTSRRKSCRNEKTPSVLHHGDCSIDKTLLLQRINFLQLEEANICDVIDVVDNLRGCYSEYRRKKLIPFTRCVEQALQEYDQEGKDVKQGEVRSCESSACSITQHQQPQSCEANTRSLLTEEPLELCKKNRPLFEDLAGIQGTLERLNKKVIVPLRHPHHFRGLGTRPLSGILIHGPSGCGKTTLAQAIANEAGVPSHLLSGNSKESIQEVFNIARRTAPSVIIIDDIDKIASIMEHYWEETKKNAVPHLVACMDEQAKEKSGLVVIVATTNKLDKIDPILRRTGRLDREILLNIPDENGRKDIISLIAGKFKIESSIDIVKLAAATHGFVGIDFLGLMNEASLVAGLRHLSERKSNNRGDLSRCGQAVLTETKPSISMHDIETALKEVRPSTRGKGFSSIPRVKWEDVGGLDHLREEFNKQIVNRIKRPKLYEALGIPTNAGFLLYGPPGCGKSLIAKAVACEAGVSFIYIQGPELLNKYVGESELAVRTVFQNARTCAPCILFFDEIDALARKTEAEYRHGDKVLTQMLTELDGAVERRGVFVIGATNRPEIIDRALLRPGRLGEHIHVTVPLLEERVLILKALSRKHPIAPDVNLFLIASDCENFSGADLASLVEKAAMEALTEALKEDTHLFDSESVSLLIKTSHFKKARTMVFPSVTREQRDHYEELARRFKST